MIVCSCRRVTDRQIAEAAESAGCVHDLVERCGAGSRCRGCWPTLERFLPHRGGCVTCDSMRVATA